MMERWQTVSLCMIVKDEEEYIGQCLKSVQGLVDEIVIVDTGSADDTIKIASSFGASIYEAPWEDNFGRSRNISLEKVRTNWILVLDADEVISERDHGLIRDLISKRNYFGFKLDQRTYGIDPNFVNWINTQGAYPEEAGYPGYVSSPLIRLFRNDPRIRFEGQVHELVEHSFSRYNLPYSLTEIPIHHYGKVRDALRIVDKGILYSRIGENKIQSSPDSRKAYSELGAQYLELKEFGKAANAFEKAVQFYPQDHESYANLGVSLLRQKDFDLAEKALLKAVSLDSRSREAHFNLGAVYMHQGRYDMAKESLNRALEIDDDFGIAFGSLGTIHLLRGEVDHAIPYLLKAACLNQGDADVFSNLAWALNRLSLPKLALPYCTRAIEISPRHPNALKLKEEIENAPDHRIDNDAAEEQVNKGERLYSMGEMEEAEVCFQNAVKRNPYHHTAWNDLGALLWDQGCQKTAKACFIRSVLLNAEDPEACDNLRICCEEMGDTTLLRLIDEVF